MTEVEFAAMVDGLESADHLVALMDESHAAYEGKSEAGVHRMRGWVLSRLARRFPTDSRVEAFAREELETGGHAYTVAAAAMAMAKFPVHLALVEAALRRVGDEPIQFDSYPLGSPAKPSTTTKSELLRLKPSESQTAGEIRPYRGPAKDFFAFEVEDYRGDCYALGEYLRGYPSFVIFFYTRCNNPNKCTANVQRWDAVRQAVGSEIRLAAISYDPEYDTPARLADYAQSRGVTLTDHARMLRVPMQFLEMRRALELKVGYSQATVNRHATEAFVLDAEGNVRADFTRTVWSVDEVIRNLVEV